MKETIIKIKNASGLHARPAALAVKEAGKYKSNITVKKGIKEVNLKSLLSVLSLGISKGEEITLKIDGIDEVEAMRNISSLLNNLED